MHITLNDHMFTLDIKENFHFNSYLLFFLIQKLYKAKCFLECRQVFSPPSPSVWNKKPFVMKKLNNNI